MEGPGRDRPDSRGRGYGKLLLLDWQQRAGVQGCEEAWLEVRAGNRAAMEMYQRTGWVETGRRIGYYSDGADALLFTLRLCLPSGAFSPTC